MAELLSRRLAWLIGAAVVLLAGAVFATATWQRDAAIRAADQQQSGQRLLTAMLDQETGARGYFQTHDAQFLQPYFMGTSDFSAALSDLRARAGADRLLRQALAEQAQRSAAWHNDAQRAIDALRTAGTHPTVAQALARKSMMDAFRASNASFAALLTRRRDHTLARSTWLAAGGAAALSILLAAAIFALARRGSRAERERSDDQTELRELLQVAESEDESRRLLIRHIERAIPDAGAAILVRNNSDDRLEPVFSGRAEHTPLQQAQVTQLVPRSCMAVRLSHAHDRRRGEEPLLECAVCGRIAADVACEPLLVGGQVIGSVLVASERAIAGRQRDRLRDSVVQAAPILANQRNLALAEARAASDALTGLPNRRAADDTLKMMAAQAGRSLSPLAAVLVDLDHFKQVNDLHGHEQGDRALAAVGQILATGLRASDFAARYGGEEFLVLLPATDREGACALAEKLRTAIEQADVTGAGPITASFGVAVLPDDATDTEQLLRRADRALYRAKEHGRNRVDGAAYPSLDGDSPGDLPLTGRTSGRRDHE